MDDLVVKGMWAGIIGALGDAIIHKLSYFIFHTSTTAQYIASLIFHKAKFTDLEYIVGFLVHSTAGAVVGIFLALIFKYFGEKYAYIKGIGLGVFMWIVHIVIIPNIITAPQAYIIRTAPETLVDLFAHLTFGMLTTTVLLKQFEKVKI